MRGSGSRLCADEAVLVRVVDNRGVAPQPNDARSAIALEGRARGARWRGCGNEAAA